MLLFASASASIDSSIDVFHRAQLDSANISYFCYRIPALVRAASGDLIAFAEGRRAKHLHERLLILPQLGIRPARALVPQRRRHGNATPAGR